MNFKNFLNLRPPDRFTILFASYVEDFNRRDLSRLNTNQCKHEVLAKYRKKTKTMSKRRANYILEIPYEISNEPENVAEAVALCGGDEKILIEHFVQKLVYNHHNAELRTAFLERVEEKTGVSRQTEKKEKGTDNQGKPRIVEVFSETEGEYFARVLAERGEKPADYSPLLQETADGYKDGDGKDVPGYPLDGTKKLRGAGGPKLAKMYIAGAEEIEKAGKLDSAASRLTEELGIKVDATVDSVARALKEREDRRRSEFVKGLL